MGRHGVRLIGVGLVAFVLLGLGSGAVLCKTALNCRPYNAIREDREALEKRLEGSAVLPAGFAETVVAKGLEAVTDFAFLPDGRLLASEKAGALRLVDPATGTSRVALDISRRVDDSLFRGLMTVAVDPEFEMNRFVYIVYTPSSLGPGDGERPTVARFSRFVLGTDGQATNERILVGTVSVRSCSRLPATADCLPSDRDHVGSQLAFGADGTIFLSTGDGGGFDERVEVTALRAQNPNSLAGKVLRITRAGKGIAGNPFAGSDLEANRAKVWAIGLRNPFRLALSPAGIPIVADVGVDYTEEVNAASRGANLGWPCWEGRRRHPPYTSTPLCKTLYAAPPATLELPLATFLHPDGKSITGGDFAPGAFPPDLRGAYFVGDWARGWLRTIRISPTGTASRARAFATGLPGPSAIHAGPGGAMYYAGLNAGEIRRISPPR